MPASAALTWVVRELAIAHGVLDLPNQRSLHLVATPRGGGIAIVLAVTIALAWLELRGAFHLDVFVALGGGGAVVAIVANSPQAIRRLAAAGDFAVDDIAPVEGRPEYLRISALTYLFGRLVNASDLLAGLRILLIAELRKPGPADEDRR